MKTTEPNQTLDVEPTTLAVTCRAYARPAPSAVLTDF